MVEPPDVIETTLLREPSDKTNYEMKRAEISPVRRKKFLQTLSLLISNNLENLTKLTSINSQPGLLFVLQNHKLISYAPKSAPKGALLCGKSA